MFLFILGTYLAVELQDHRVTPCLLRNCPTVAKWLYPFTFRAVMYGVPVSVHLHQNLLVSFLFDLASQVDAKWHLTVVLICISLMIMLLSIFLC